MGLVKIKPISYEWIKEKLISHFHYTAFAAKEFHETEQEFEQEFGILEDPATEAKNSKNLEKAEEDINKNNEMFAKGQSTYKKRLYAASDLDKNEFDKEKEGAIMPKVDATLPKKEEPTKRYFGALMPPENERSNAANDVALRNLYRRLAANRDSVPDSYDARSLGRVWSLYFVFDSLQ